MLRKLLLAALLVLGVAAAAPQGAFAAPVGPGLALNAEALPAAVEKAQFYYGRPYYRRHWRPRPYFYRRPYYRRPYYAPRPYYRRPYYGRRFYY